MAIPLDGWPSRFYQLIESTGEAPGHRVNQ
jgi:hypothetical protein